MRLRDQEDLKISGGSTVILSSRWNLTEPNGKAAGRNSRLCGLHLTKKMIVGSKMKCIYELQDVRLQKGVFDTAMTCRFYIRMVV
mmetsp:Transcript_27574/g.62573  ORF Transcript_27574/g.62573 Transcript_27574/m.62573 type:complete len:85 (+) Transcript_27574:227-481(+)